MRLTTILHSARRRWYVLLGGLVVTTVLCVLAYSHTHPVYQRNASELLVPGSQTVPKGGNLFLYLGGLDQASDVLVQALGAKSVQGPLQAQYPDTTVSITRDASSTGPILLISVAGQNNGDVEDVFQRMLEAGPITLESLQEQASVPPAARITMLAVDVDAKSTTDNKTRIEIGALVAVAGVALSVLLVALVDGLAIASRRPRGRTREAQPQGGEGARGEWRRVQSNVGRVASTRLPRRARTRPPTQRRT